MTRAPEEGIGPVDRPTAIIEEEPTVDASETVQRDHDGVPGLQPSDDGRRVTGPAAASGPSAAQLAQERAVAGPPGHVGDSREAIDDKGIHRALPELTDDDLRRLSVLDDGVALEQGGTYLDLDDLAAGPFTAMGGETSSGRRVVSKRETDYEMWNRLTGRDADGDGVRDEAQQG